MQGTAKTLEQFFVEQMDQGTKMLPLVLACLPADLAWDYQSHIKKKAAEQHMCLRAVAMAEYLYAVACGTIPVTTSFGDYYTEGDIPDQYGWSMVLFLMEKASLCDYDLHYRYLYHVVDMLVGPL